MTPTRILVGLAVVAAAGYVVISSSSSEGPKYLGDMPSIMAHSAPAPPPVTHITPGAPVPDPPHYAARPVTPDSPAGSPPAVPGPGALGPAAPAGAGTGLGGQPNAQPGVGSPPSNLLPGGLPLLGSVPTAADLGKVCVVANKVYALIPCDQLPAGTFPPGGVTLP